MFEKVNDEVKRISGEISTLLLHAREVGRTAVNSHELSGSKLIDLDKEVFGGYTGNESESTAK